MAQTSVLRLVQRNGKKPRKSPAGISTNDLVFSSYQGRNAEIFSQIMGLYVPKGSLVADVTYGRGAFWGEIPRGDYSLLKSDLLDGVNCRTLPYPDAHVDCLILDPPYMHTPGGSAHEGHQNFERYYQNNESQSGLKYHEAVLDLYFAAGREAFRVLRPHGVFIVKCQDEVCANRQRLTHVELLNEFSRLGFVPEDCFVLMRQNRPGVSRMLKQIHARKNHSYFLVLRKPKPSSRTHTVRAAASVKK